MKTKKSKTLRQLRYESLEGRRMMAADTGIVPWADPVGAKTEVEKLKSLCPRALTGITLTGPCGSQTLGRPLPHTRSISRNQPLPR